MSRIISIGEDFADNTSSGVRSENPAASRRGAAASSKPFTFPRFRSQRTDTRWPRLRCAIARERVGARGPLNNE